MRQLSPADKVAENTPTVIRGGKMLVSCSSKTRDPSHKAARAEAAPPTDPSLSHLKEVVVA